MVCKNCGEPIKWLSGAYAWVHRGRRSHLYCHEGIGPTRAEQKD